MPHRPRTRAHGAWHLVPSCTGTEIMRQPTETHSTVSQPPATTMKTMQAFARPIFRSSSRFRSSMRCPWHHIRSGVGAGSSALEHPQAVRAQSRHWNARANIRSGAELQTRDLTAHPDRPRPARASNQRDHSECMRAPSGSARQTIKGGARRRRCDRRRARGCSRAFSHD